MAISEAEKNSTESLPFVMLRFIKEGYEHALGTHGPTRACQEMRKQALDYLPSINAELDTPKRRNECIDYMRRHGSLPPCSECERKIVVAEGHTTVVAEVGELTRRLEKWVDR